MSGLFHEFLDTINIQRLDWSSFNKKLERILKIYEGKDLVNTKIQEARELLAPSWSHLCVKAKEELDNIFSKVCEEAERKTLKSRDVAYLCPSTLQIFTLVWEVDHFQDWRSELPRKMLQQLLEEIITLGNKSRSLMAQRDAVKAKKELWEDWETLRPESQCRILVELMIFKDTIFNIVQNNKTEAPIAPEDQLHNFHIHGNAAWSEQVMDPTFNGTPVQAYQHLPSSLGVYQPEQDQNLNNLDPSGFTFPCDANPSYRHNYYPH
ncbi:hypothetical protein JCM3765_003390 [Sporobolomyces pararoseus]